jgi:hypothetical protein
MQRLAVSLVIVLLAGAAFAQKPPAKEQAPSPMYPAPPPEAAPKVDKGASLDNLSSPLAGAPAAPTQTAIDSDAEAQLFIHAARIVWGRYAKIKGAKPGSVVVTKQGPLWTIKGRLDSVAPGSEGDWVSIDAVVERIEAGKVHVRGEVAFRVAKVQNGTPCKIAGPMLFRRSGKSQVWRLAEGDNPCDGTQELFDLVYEKPVEKKPVPAQPKRG